MVHLNENPHHLINKATKGEIHVSRIQYYLFIRFLFLESCFLKINTYIHKYKNYKTLLIYSFKTNELKPKLT